MDMNQYLDIFIEEAKEHLLSMNESLLELEKNPNDKDLLNQIFRVSHTVKGMAGTMGFSKVSNLTHEMENLLHAVRNGEKEITSEIIDILFECFDALEEYVTNISTTGEEGDLETEHLVQALNDILNNKSSKVEGSNNESIETADNKIQVSSNGVKLENANEYVLNVLNKAKEKDLNAFKVDVTVDESCMLKAARAFIVFNKLERHSEIIQSNPPAEDIEDEKFEDSFSIVLVTRTNKKEIEDDIMSISEINNVVVSSIDLGEIEDSQENIEGREDEKPKEEESDEKEIEIKSQDKKKTTNRFGKTVRVDIDRLDNLMNLVSELIIIKTRMEDIGESSERQNMNEAIEYLERITTNLHDAVMKVRMVPIERVFNRFPRMVRDLSKELGKSINLEMSGEETEVDRTVIDEIGDPLIHLIRNSIDHGIEGPEERTKNGKDEEGTVKLIAYPDGNNVVIEVADDGKGIDIEKVKQKAISKGVISKDQAKNLSKEESVELLFSAGFSTADQISDISGRGVGLDVVKTKIESIGGNVEVETNTNKGSKFIIRLPLTLAIIQALLIKLQDEIYAIPISSIREISPISSKDITKVQDQEVVLFRNRTLPIVRLNKKLGLEQKKDKEELIAVIVKKGDKEAGVIVDNLIGQQEIVIKSLGKYLTGIKYIAGATILGNGEISLILDVNSLF
ncbi:chemotaxis protein CheA [Sporosalibacterium faouarense]|uniref:chemotaxis protein CheA n=1 Tax=Sporosalibacterium faouarense TaxID=516123 RepID=UPI00192B2981|nr:chemotaxis protein CheA [Sporosalibacterium faouarense]